MCNLWVGKCALLPSMWQAMMCVTRFIEWGPTLSDKWGNQREVVPITSSVPMVNVMWGRTYVNANLPARKTAFRVADYKNTPHTSLTLRTLNALASNPTFRSRGQ